MQKPDQKLYLLFKKYLDYSCTSEEYIEFLDLLRVYGDDPKMGEYVLKALAEDKNEHVGENVDWERMLQNILAQKQKEKPVRSLFPRIAVAASVIAVIVLGAGYIYFAGRKQAKENIVTLAAETKTPAVTPLPGKEGAILKLADGTEIILDEALNGPLAVQGGAEIVKLNGKLAYVVEGNEKAPVVYNTMSTPRGRQYHLILPDETKVWLNAASSIRFPTSFRDDVREVDITGEVYFEVTKSANKNGESRPFIVNSRGMKVEVLGTSFNINAYEDEASIKTTLVEGSVRVSFNDDSRIIKPGQKADIIFTGLVPKIVVGTANVAEDIAWKNGVMQIESADITTIMRQVSRWYDVDVEYEGKIPQRIFTVDVSRNSSISELLEILKLSNINFRIEEKKIVVIP